MYLKSKVLTNEIEKKINNLLDKMTLEEKIGQLHQVGPSPVGAFDIPESELKKMLETGRITQEEYELSKTDKILDKNEDKIRNGEIGSFLGLSDPKRINRLQRIAVEESRMGIPLLIGCDVIHGFNTVFPTPIAESCSFDDELFEQTASVAAKEARAAGINWVFAPMLDISRDARWGRIAESMGQDPFLAGNYAERKVRGFQGDDLSDNSKIAACAKHFLAYGACEGGKDYNTVDMSLSKLYDVYLPPFKRAVESGIASIMTSFNDINGVPMTANKLLIKNVLHDELGFDGVVVSDATAVRELTVHGYSKDKYAATRDALCAGVDIDMNSYTYFDCLKELVEKGEVQIDNINEAVKSILRLKFALGLFDNPYCDFKKLNEVSCTNEHLALAKKAALHSTVLLKNNGVLPINKEKHKNISLIGELSDSISESYGCWTIYAKDEHTVTLKDALCKEGVQYTRCYGVKDELNEDEFKTATENADLIIAVLGESRHMSGEAHSYADISLPESQKSVVKRLKELEKPFICVLYNGRPLCVPEVDQSADAIVEAWQLGTKMGEALADIIFGRFNPCGKLTSNFPYKSGECPSYYNHPNTGRPAATDSDHWTCKYDDGRIKPIYSFGHGLSYTTFEYSELQIEKTESYLNVSVKITNSGNYDGYEVAQLYIHDKFASKVRPVRELKGYKKLYLRQGENKVVNFILPYSDLGFHNDKLEYVIEKGDFEIFVGTDSECELKSEFTL